MQQWRLTSIKIQGYRPFRECLFTFRPVVVLVGANGTGKSSLFEFLKFLRNAAHQEIPTEIISGSIGQQIFHVPGPEKFWWSAEIDILKPVSIRYQGEVLGPVGRTHVSFERVTTSKPLSSQHNRPFLFMNVREGSGVVHDPEIREFRKQKIALIRRNQLALSTMMNPRMATLYNLREYICGWRFYSSFNIANDKIRKSVPIEQEPTLHEDAGNLSSVLHFLMTEHTGAFDELQQHLSSVVPGFQGLTVKARGGPGEVIAFWREKGVDKDLTLADLSDGILRLICWMVLCIQPNPPSLICIDEPDQGVHPRTLPVLAGLFEKATRRTQLVLATHASYFLMQFKLDRIAVMKKVNGQATFLRPSDSKILRESLEDFGPEELENMHRTDEMEHLA
jgi:predicted ATPase